MKTSSCFVLLLALAFNPPRAHCQFRSAIEGTVSDSSGAILPGVQVIVTNELTRVVNETSSSEGGVFRVVQLPPGRYRIEIRKEGFQGWVQTGIALEGNETRTVYPSLKVGEQVSIVEVTAAAAVVDTSSAKVTRSIETKTIEQVPMVGRNLFGSVAALAPGITGSGGLFGGATGSGSLGQDSFQLEPGFQINAAGQRQEQNEYQVDGASVNGNSRDGIVNLTPQPDTVQEIRVSANSFTADKGRNSGALVEVFTKSGTNALHGTLSHFHTNNRLTGRTVFQRTVPVFRRNEFGFTLGGPIRRNKTFFFGSFYRLDSSSGQTSTDRVETAEFRNFLKSRFPSAIATRFFDRAPAELEPVSDLWSAARVRSANPGRFPSEMFPDSLPVVGTAFVNQTLIREGLQWNLRIDQNWTRDRIYGNWYGTRSKGQQASVRPLFRVFTPNDGEFLKLNWTRSITPALLHEASFSFVRAAGSNPGTADDKSLPNVSITGLTGFNQGGPFGWAHNNYNWSEVLSWVRGNHQLKFGTDIDRQTGWQDQERTQIRPSFTFANTLDFAQDLPFTQTGPAINVRTGALGTGLYRYAKMLYIGSFVQDDWKVSRRVTLNLGLRWDYFGRWASGYNRDLPFHLFTPGDGTMLPQRVASGAMRVRGNGYMIDNRPNGFSPRFGLAWDVFGNGSTSLRGGYGMFLSRVANLSFITPNNANAPDFAFPSLSVLQGARFGYGLGNADGTQFPLPPGISYTVRPDGSLVGSRVGVGGLERTVNQPRTHSWSLSLQQRIGRSWVADVSYLGSYSSDLYVQTDVNRFAGDLIQNAGRLTRLHPNFNAIVFGRTIGESWGNIGSFGLGRRFAGGLSLKGIYTFGRAIDYNSSNDNGVGGGRNVVDAFDLGPMKGPSDYNISRRLSVDGVWESPDPWKQGWKSKALGGWRVSTIAILQSGRPFSVFTSAPFPAGDFNGDGFNFDYPNAPGFPASRSFDRGDYIRGLFAAADFPRPSAGTQGSLGRNVFSGPGLANVNLAIIKPIAIRWFASERASLEIRGELFNLFNRVNLTQPSGDVASGLFGRSTDQSLPRAAQFGLRIQF